MSTDRVRAVMKMLVDAGEMTPTARRQINRVLDEPTESVTVAPAMLVSAVRYALGRRTYIVSWTISETLREWKKLSAQDRATIRRDVSETLAHHGAGDAADEDNWRRLLAATEE